MMINHLKELQYTNIMKRQLFRMGKKTLGSQLNALRKSRRLTQKSLAIMCGWECDGQARISNYEKDRRSPSIDDLTKISLALGVEISEIINMKKIETGSKTRITAPLISIENGLEQTGETQEFLLDKDLIYNAGALVAFENKDPLMVGDFEFSKQIIIIDTSLRSPENNRYFLIIDDEIPIFRKILKSGHTIYLVPTSKGFSPKQSSENITVYGTALIAITEF